MRYVLYAEAPEIKDEQIWLGDFDSMEDAKVYADSLSENMPEDLSPYHEFLLFDKEVKVKYFYEWDGMSQNTYFEKTDF